MSELTKLIQKAKEQGFLVYAPEKLTTYFWVTDGKNVGYCQVNRLGIKYSTVHKPYNRSGTGYEASSFMESLQHKPDWALNNSVKIVKYESINEFVKEHYLKLIQY